MHSVWTLIEDSKQVLNLAWGVQGRYIITLCTVHYGGHLDCTYCFRYFYFITILIAEYFCVAGGFLYVDEVLRQKGLQQYTEADVRRVVAENDKQRFQLNVDCESGRLRIRANQGHTVEVSSYWLLSNKCCWNWAHGHKLQRLLYSSCKCQDFCCMYLWSRTALL